MGEYQLRRQGFLEAGCDGNRSALSALHFVPLCLQSAAGGNSTLELISNCIPQKFFLFQINRENKLYMVLIKKIFIFLINGYDF